MRKSSQRFYQDKARFGAAKVLKKEFHDYLSRIWTREKDFESFPDTATERRKATHALARALNGESLVRRSFLQSSTRKRVKGSACLQFETAKRIQVAPTLET
jgi:hypothetical protein